MITNNSKTTIKMDDYTKAMSEIAPMVLSAGDSKIFLEALERDFEPSEALLDLKKRYDSLNIVDRT